MGDQESGPHPGAIHSVTLDLSLNWPPAPSLCSFVYKIEEEVDPRTCVYARKSPRARGPKALGGRNSRPGFQGLPMDFPTEFTGRPPTAQRRLWLGREQGLNPPLLVAGNSGRGLGVPSTCLFPPSLHPAPCSPPHSPGAAGEAEGEGVERAESL